MSNRWFDSSRQIFWDNNQQDLSIPGSVNAQSAIFESLYAPELYPQIAGASIGANLTAVPSITPGDDWRSVAMSASGQYQSAVAFGTGSAYITSDYGATWQSGAFLSGGLIKISVSASGQYQTAVSTVIHISSDYGATWTQTNVDQGALTYTSISMSASGQYQTVVVDNTYGNGYIYVSSDYGNTWTPIVIAHNWRDVAVSASGQYQTAIGDDASAYRSNNYGVSWSPVTVSAGVTSYSRISMSATGQYQAVVNDGVTDNIHLSNDYGITWATTGSTLSWNNIVVSASGQYMIAYEVDSSYLWISTDYGVTWNTNSVAITNLSGMALSASGNYFTIVIQSDTIYTSTTPVILPNIQGGVFNISSLVGDIAEISSLTTSSFSTLIANIGSLNTSSIVINSIDNSTAQISSLTAVNISSFQAQIGDLITSSIVSNNLSSFRAQISSIQALNVSTVQGTINRLTASSIVSNNLSSFTGQISSLITLNVSSLRGQVGGLITSSIVSNNLSSLTGQISSLITLNISTVQETVNAITASSIVSNNVSSFTSQVSSLTALNISSLREQTGAFIASSIVSNNVSSFTSQVSSFTALNISSLREQTGAFIASSIVSNNVSSLTGQTGIFTASTIIVGPQQSPGAFYNNVSAAGLDLWSPTIFASTSIKIFPGAAAGIFIDMTQYIAGANANANVYFRSISSGVFTYPLTLSTSRVGINTITPLYTLDVTGTGRISTFIVGSSNLPPVFSTNDHLFVNGFLDVYNTTQTSTLIRMAGASGRNFIQSGTASTASVFAPADIVFGSPGATSEYVRFTSTGRVGIGTATPAYTLDVTGTGRFVSEGEALRVQATQNSNSLFTTFQKATVTSYVGWFGFGLQGPAYSNYFGMQGGVSTSLAFYTGTTGGGSPSLFLGSNSRVGILTDTPAYTLDVNGTARLKDTLLSGTLTIPSTTTANSSRIDFPATSFSIVCGVSTLGGTNQVANKCQIMTYTGAAVVSAFTVGTDRTKLIGINNCNDPQYTLDVNGSTHQSNNLTTWGVTSDRRIKTNIEFANLDICYSSIQALALRRYEYDSNLFPNREDKHVIGLVAQEVQPIFPKAVTQTSSFGFSDLLGIDYDQLYMANLGATKKLMEVVEQQGSTIQGIQQQLSTLQRI